MRSEEKKYEERFPYLKLNQVIMTRVHLPVLLQPFQNNLNCMQFEGHERGLFPVCVCVCVYRGTLRRSTRKWVSEPLAAGLIGGWREGVACSLMKKKKLPLQQVTFQYGNSKTAQIDTVVHSWLPATG